MSDDIEGKIVALFKQATSKTTQNDQEGSGWVTITGKGNIVGNNNTIFHAPPKIVQKVELRPGEDHISDTQAATLQGLVGEIVRLSETLKKSPKSYQSVWGSLKRKFKVPHYRAISSDDFEKAEKFLRMQIGELTDMKSARKILPGWRKKRYAAIKARTKQNGTESQFREYLNRNFHVRSITELDDAELDTAYRRAMSMKPVK